MIIIHRGKGAIIIALSGIASGLIMHAVVRALFGRHYYSEHIWPLFGTFWLAGLFCMAAGSYLRKRPSQVGQDGWFENEAPDHLFFIPLIYWGPVYFAAGIVYLIYSFR
jgi:hypothetical protein